MQSLYIAFAHYGIEILKNLLHEFDILAPDFWIFNNSLVTELDTSARIGPYELPTSGALTLTAQRSAFKGTVQQDRRHKRGLVKSTNHQGKKQLFC